MKLPLTTVVSLLAAVLLPIAVTPAQAAAPTSASPRASTQPDAGQSHRQAAMDYAANYYRYEFQAGSNAIRVTSVRIEASAAKAIAGWTGRYRTEGTAHLEIFDSKGLSYTRAKSSFEIITEEKPGESIAIIDFARKS